MNTEDKESEQRILQCIDDGLGVLGDSTKRVVYYNLSKNGLKKIEIPAKPQTFCKGLAKIFGEEGAIMIEKCIVEKLQTSFELKPQPEISLAKTVNIIKIRQKKRPRRSILHTKAKTAKP